MEEDKWEKLAINLVHYFCFSPAKYILFPYKDINNYKQLQIYLRARLKKKIPKHMCGLADFQNAFTVLDLWSCKPRTYIQVFRYCKWALGADLYVAKPTSRDTGVELSQWSVKYEYWCLISPPSPLRHFYYFVFYLPHTVLKKGLFSI